MKTTEIFVEQVIIGGLVMLIGYILFQQNIIDYLECLSSHFTNIKPFAQISLGALLVGTAYLIGMVYDRFTDTLFQDLERHCRWNFVLRKIKLEKDLKYVLELVKSKKDVFAENVYRMAVMDSDIACQKEDYFRRRLRLTRAFATLIPGISIAVIFQLSISCNNKPWYKIYVALIPLAYLLAFFSKNSDCKFIRGDAPPKTNDWHGIEKYHGKTNDSSEKDEDHRKCKSKLKRSILISMLFDRTCQILFLVFMILALVNTILLRSIKYFIIMVIGIIFSTIVAWTWWRVYHTYFQFLQDFYEANIGKKSK